MDRHEEIVTREFICAGTIAAAVYNVNRDSKRHAQPFTYRDVFPHLASPQGESDEANARAIDLMFTAMSANYRKLHPDVNGGSVARKKISRSEMVD